MWFRPGVHLYFELESVVGQLNMGKAHLAKTFICFGVREVVGNVREPRSARFQLLNEGQGLVHGLMHGMRNIAQSVENKFIEVFE